MTSTLLDVSQRPELGLHAQIAAAVEAAAAPLGAAPLIAGAFARDLHLMYAHGISVQRLTEDIDFALAVPDWAAYSAAVKALLQGGEFTASPTAAHRLRHRNGLPLDLVPFGAVERSDRRIAWPPRGDVVMDVFGYREALASSVGVLLPGSVSTRVVSLAALALLKLVCWRERHYEAPRKDAYDLHVILKHYLAAGNEERLFSDFNAWTQQDDFDYELAGARMLGHDLRALLDAAGLARVDALLSEQASEDVPARLPAEMNPYDQDAARRLLIAMRGGMHEGR